MMKKLITVFMAVMLLFAFTLHNSADAKGYRSGIKSHTTTPSRSQSHTTDNYTKPNSTKPASSSTTSSRGTANRGFFSGGSFMKGMLIGGLSGLLFGSLFSQMGGFGSFLGFAVNIFAIYLIIVIAVAIFRRIARSRKPDHRDGRY